MRFEGRSQSWFLHGVCLEGRGYDAAQIPTQVLAKDRPMLIVLKDQRQLGELMLHPRVRRRREPIRMVGAHG